MARFRTAERSGPTMVPAGEPTQRTDEGERAGPGSYPVLGCTLHVPTRKPSLGKLVGCGEGPRRVAPGAPGDEVPECPACALEAFRIARPRGCGVRVLYLVQRGWDEVVHDLLGGSDVV